MKTPSIQQLAEKYSGADICIIGNGPSGMALDLSEYTNPIWTVNGGWKLHPESELAFIMDDWHGPAWRHPGCNFEFGVKEINTAKVPIITSCAYPQYKNFVEYPLLDVLRYFDPGKKWARPYFGETTNYIVAWAIMIGVRSLDLHGIDYINIRPDERASLEYWCGRARQYSGKPEIGMQITVNTASHFLKTQELDGLNRHVPGLYGYLPQNVPLPYRELPNGSIRIQILD